MSSTYKSQDIFGSGPHRFTEGERGLFVVGNSALAGVPAPGSTALGVQETEVVVTGRLMAATDSALWTIRDAITALLVFPQTPGTLVDHHGRSWANMTFISFEVDDRTDRGRDVSIGYTAVFRDLIGL